MSHYREINRELVDEVRKMRKEMKLYHDEIIRLKGELMEKHESEVDLRKRCYNLAVNNFIELIQTMEPDSDILPALKEHAQPQGGLSAHGRVHCRSRISDERASIARRRRSSALAMELQKSNSVVTLRKSVCCTSPIRRSSREYFVQDEQRNSFQQGSEEEQGVMSAGNEILQTRLSPIDTTDCAVDNVIFEESNEEDDSKYESIIEVDSFEMGSTLKDVTSTLTGEVKSSKNVNSHIQAKTENSCDQDNNTTCATSVEMEKVSNTEEETTNEISKCRRRLTDHTVADIEEETLQELRRLTSSGESLHARKSYGITLAINEVSMNSPTLLNSDLAFRDFNNPTGISTPKSVQNSVLNCTSSTSRTDYTTESGSINISTRPSRKCKPTSLAEPKINTKIRSEIGTKPKRNSKSRSKSKK